MDYQWPTQQLGLLFTTLLHILRINLPSIGSHPLSSCAPVVGKLKRWLSFSCISVLAVNPSSRCAVIVLGEAAIYNNPIYQPSTSGNSQHMSVH